MKRYRIGFAVLGVISVPAVAAACWPMWGRPRIDPRIPRPCTPRRLTLRPCMDTPRRFTARRCATRCRTPSAHPFGGPRRPRLCFRLRASRPSPRQQCPHRHRERGVRFPHQCRPLLFPCVRRTRSWSSRSAARMRCPRPPSLHQPRPSPTTHRARVPGRRNWTIRRSRFPRICDPIRRFRRSNCQSNRTRVRSPKVPAVGAAKDMLIPAIPSAAPCVRVRAADSASFAPNPARSRQARSASLAHAAARSAGRSGEEARFDLAIQPAHSRRSVRHQGQGLPNEGGGKPGGRYRIVGFYNHTTRDLELTIEGRSVKLPAKSYLYAQLGTAFTWSIGNRPSTRERVPEDAGGLEVVFGD